jgi:hypothetical protein
MIMLGLKIEGQQIDGSFTLLYSSLGMCPIHGLGN